MGELLLDVGAVEAGQLLLPLGAPRKHVRERLGQRPLRVHPVRVDRKAGVLARETLFRLAEPALVAHDVDHIGRVAAVEHAEIRVQPQPRRVAPDQAIGDRMEGARPRQLHFLAHFAHDALRPARHLHRSAAREREQQDALRAHALLHQVRHAVRERVGLAGAGAGDDQERAGAKRLVCRTPAIAGGGALCGVQGVQGGDGCHRGNYKG